jgi:hypothetical protein
VPHTSIHRVEADGVTVFYREAGAADAPVVLLLHGFPTSSFQYRELIPRLADRYRVIALGSSKRNFVTFVSFCLISPSSPRLSVLSPKRERASLIGITAKSDGRDDALRKQHPEWIEQSGDCPTCESYESRFAELLDPFQIEQTQAGRLTKTI